MKNYSQEVRQQLDEFYKGQIEVLKAAKRMQASQDAIF